ncbi:MAG: hypothetical protein ACTS3F_07550 [Phycisphaerales bacterium]
MRTVVVLKSTREQLGNQLLPYMSVQAYCLERSCRLVYLPFERYLGHFERMAAVPRGGFRRRVMYRWYRLVQGLGVGAARRYPKGADPGGGGASGPRFVRLPPSSGGVDIGSPGLEFFLGWRYYNPLGIARHRAAIQREFAPARAHLAGIASFVEALPGDRPIVGVHIRQGDYKTHMGGRLYIPPEEYRDAMAALTERIGAHPVFCVFSDQPLPEGVFDGFDVRLSDGSMIEDLFRMAHCPLVIGTASTFNLAAVLYGGGVVWHLRPDHREILDPEGADPEIVLDVESAGAAIAGRNGPLRLGIA